MGAAGVVRQAGIMRRSLAHAAAPGHGWRLGLRPGAGWASFRRLRQIGGASTASSGGISVGLGASAGSDGTSSRSSSDMDQSSILSRMYCVFTSLYAAIVDKFHASGNKKTATPEE